MLRIYVNYPNPRVTVHADPSCGYVRMMDKPQQRVVRIDPSTISVEIQRFIGKQYTFASQPDSNDMWLEIDFNDREFEEAVLWYVHRCLGRHYKPLRDSQIKTHCP